MLWRPNPLAGKASTGAVPTYPSSPVLSTGKLPYPVPTGTHQIRVEFAHDGGGLAKGGDVTLYYDGSIVGSGRVENTQPLIFSADETTDIGYESGTTVSPDYTTETSRFNGKIGWVQTRSRR